MVTITDRRTPAPLRNAAPGMMNPPRTAAALIIGNELLTGKIQDRNLAVLATELFGLGIALRRVIFCSDEVEVIVTDLNELRGDHDVVFTSGGVGPTHDDVTLEAVARAFDQRLRRSPEIEALLKEFFGDRLTPHHLRMADLPEGAVLVTAAETSAGPPAKGRRWPVVRVGNVYILPGLPKVFRRKLPLLREELAGDSPFISRNVATRSDEGTIAPLLRSLAERHPMVSIGSYPRWDDGPVRVMVSFDGRDARQVDHAVAALLSALPPDQIVDQK